MTVRFSLADRIRVSSVARGEAAQAAAAAGPHPSLSPEAVLDLCDTWFLRAGQRHVGERLTVEELSEQLHQLAAHARVLAEDADRLSVRGDAAELARGYATGMERAAYLLTLLRPTGVPR